VDLPGGTAGVNVQRGNYGAPHPLPERWGPIGANGLASERDLRAPTAAYEERGARSRLVQKFGGNLWAARYGHRRWT